jgi:hypothetical protein
MREQTIDPTDPQETTEPTPKNNMGRPNKHLNEEQLKTVKAMASYGIPQREIAKHVGMAANTLRKRYRKELTHAAHDANLQVLDSLFNMATNRHCVAAAIFWVKSRCAYRPGGAPYENAIGVIRQPQKPAKTEKPKKESDYAKDDPTYDDGQRVEFTVYNNDG